MPNSQSSRRMAWSTSWIHGPCSSRTACTPPLSSNLAAIAPPATPAPMMTTSACSVEDTTDLLRPLVGAARGLRKRRVLRDPVAEGLRGTVVVRAGLAKGIGHAAGGVVAVVDPVPQAREAHRVFGLQAPQRGRDGVRRGLVDGPEEALKRFPLRGVGPLGHETGDEGRRVRETLFRRDHDVRDPAEPATH